MIDTQKEKKGKSVFELVRASRCYNCDQKLLPGALVMLVKSETEENLSDQEKEVFCQVCAGLSEMEVVKSGNAKLTRLAKKYSKTFYVIVKWSELWKTYERQGILAEKSAIAKAQQEI